MWPRELQVEAILRRRWLQVLQKRASTGGLIHLSSSHESSLAKPLALRASRHSRMKMTSESKVARLASNEKVKKTFPKVGIPSVQSQSGPYGACSLPWSQGDLTLPQSLPISIVETMPHPHKHDRPAFQARTVGEKSMEVTAAISQNGCYNRRGDCLLVTGCERRGIRKRRAGY